jgi:hypothetical protein
VASVHPSQSGITDIAHASDVAKATPAKVAVSTTERTGAGRACNPLLGAPAAKSAAERGAAMAKAAAQ